MMMKIDPIGKYNAVQNYRIDKTLPKKNLVDSGVDKAEFSDNAMSVSKAITELKKYFGEQQTDEQARVADIARRVRHGEYQLDPKKLTEKMIRDIAMR